MRPLVFSLAPLLLVSAGLSGAEGLAEEASHCVSFLLCLGYDVQSHEDASADCPRTCTVGIAVSEEGNASTYCSRHSVFGCTMVAIARSGHANSTCDVSALCVASLSVGKAASVQGNECSNCPAHIAVASDGDSYADCWDPCVPLAASTDGNASTRCQCVATVAFATENAKSEAPTTSPITTVVAAALLGDAAASCVDSCPVFVISVFGDSRADCGRFCRAFVAASGTGYSDARQDCHADDCLILAASGTGDAHTIADCRGGCASVHAASLLGDAFSHCDGCAPVAVAGGGAEATCRLDDCRPVAVGVTEGAHASCSECDTGGLAPAPGVAASVFGDATTSCSGGCSGADYVAVSGTGRAGGEHAVSGCETGEALGTGALCRSAP